nr:MarR family transcriptional regulator [uncultured Acetatifactor sp.]
MQTVDDPAADINDGLILSLRDLHHTMRSLYEGKASQKRILIILNGLEAITQRDLTERLGIQPGSASEILSKLEGSGWIVRTQNESDRRTTDISLTDSGRKVAEEALKQRRQRHEEMFSCLSGEEKQELLSLLDKVRCDWKKRYKENEDTFRHGHRHGRRDEGGHHEGHGHWDEGGHHEGHGCWDEGGHHEGHGRRDEGRHHEGHGRRDEGSHHEGHGRRDEGRHHEGHGHWDESGHHGGSNGHGGR